MSEGEVKSRVWEVCNEYGVITYHPNDFPHYRIVCQFGPNPILDALPDVWMAGLMFVDQTGESIVTTEDGAVDLFSAETLEEVIAEGLERIYRLNVECRTMGLKCSGRRNNGSKKTRAHQGVICRSKGEV